MRDAGEDRPASDDEVVRAAVLRLSRPHPSGGRVVERAALMAAGSAAMSMLRWVEEHGQPEALSAGAASGGLHGARESSREARQTLRYVLSADVLSPPA